MKKPVGEQELALLRWVAEHGPVTVGEAAERFGEAQGLARSTVLTVMERLRGKGHLTRRKVEGVYQYSSSVALPELLRHNYAPGFATGTIAVGGTLGILIPPSVILVVYGISTEQNIAKLFMAALVPGLALLALVRRRLPFALALAGCLLAEPVRLPLVPPAAPRGAATAWRGS